MPVWGRRGSYTMVAFTVTVLVAVNVVAYFGRRLIPPPEPTVLSTSPADYVRAGAGQRVKWRVLGDRPFAEARRLDRPLAIVMGAPWSAVARQADQDVFSDAEVAERLNSEFVSVRIDIDENPEWLDAFLPLSRAATLVDPGFQMWIVDPEGRVLAFRTLDIGGGSISQPSVLEALSEARTALEALRQDDSRTTATERIQDQERDRLLRPGEQAVPDWGGYLGRLILANEGQFGGMPREGAQRWFPSEWRFMLDVGRPDAVQRSLAPLVLSPLVDTLRGGLFRMSTDLGARVVQYDQRAVTTATMAAVFAQLTAQTGDPYARWLAESGFDRAHRMMTERIVAEGWDSAPRDDLGRSAATSFSPRVLRRLFDAGDRDWLEEWLGLDVATNPQMSPFIVRPDAFLRDPEPYRSYLERLRRASDASVIVRGRGDRMDTLATVAAELLRTARWLDDPARASRAQDVFRLTDPLRVGPDDVVHETREDGQSPRSLGDYVAFADAALEAWRTNGDTTSLAEGFAVLQRSGFLFGMGRNPGLFGAGPGPEDTGVLTLQLPDLVDDEWPASSARAVALQWAYGRLFGHLPDGGRLVAQAKGALGQFGPAANLGPRGFGSFFSAARAVAADDCALVVGPGAAETARRLGRMFPVALVGVAAGPVRPDLQARGPGVYLCRDGEFTGPLTEAEATARWARPAP